MVEPRVHICGLPVTDPSVRALTLTVGRKKKNKPKAERMSHGFRAATLLGFPQFAHLQPQVFFSTRLLPQLNAASITGRACCAAPPERLLSRLRRTRQASEPAGGDSQFYLTASRAELAGAVSGTEGAEVETFFQKLHS